MIVGGLTEANFKKFFHKAWCWTSLSEYGEGFAEVNWGNFTLQIIDDNLVAGKLLLTLSFNPTWDVLATGGPTVFTWTEVNEFLTKQRERLNF